MPDETPSTWISRSVTLTGSGFVPSTVSPAALGVDDADVAFVEIRAASAHFDLAWGVTVDVGIDHISVDGQDEAAASDEIERLFAKLVELQSEFESDHLEVSAGLALFDARFADVLHRVADATFLSAVLSEGHHVAGVSFHGPSDSAEGRYHDFTMVRAPDDRRAFMIGVRDVHLTETRSAVDNLIKGGLFAAIEAECDSTRERLQRWLPKS